jgi:glutamate racemase
LRLADSAPDTLGLPYGRWSVEKLRQYLLRACKKITCNIRQST